MTTLITKDYKQNLAAMMYDDLQSEDYYILCADGDTVPVVDSKLSKLQFLEHTIFGKKIEDVMFVFREQLWSQGTIYEAYDDSKILDKPYVVVRPEDNTTGAYLVFKCLSNNYGSRSEIVPQYIPENDTQVYKTSDGYVWKYLFAISTLDYNKYATRGYLPILATPDSSIANSSLDTFEVTNHNTNFGYETITGSLVNVSSAGVITIQGDSLSDISNRYANMSIYVTSPTNLGGLYQIDTYSYNNVSQRGQITIVGYEADSVLVPGSTFTISPRIEVLGDGTGCQAIPIIESGRIVDILVFDSGSGYTTASARVIDPMGFIPDISGSTQERAIIRPILSPIGGHGVDFITDLNVLDILVFAAFTNADNLVLPHQDTDYTKVGLVKSPEFTESTDVFDNRIRIETDTTAGIEVGETVSQLDGTGQQTFQATIHSTTATEIFLVNYLNPYGSDQTLTDSLPLLVPSVGSVPINSITTPVYQQKTGDVFYVQTLTNPVSRTDESNEEFRLLLSF